MYNTRFEERTEHFFVNVHSQQQFIYIIVPKYGFKFQFLNLKL
jgi:hypothetical protein